MKSLLYLIAIILLIGWILGTFIWHATDIIYILFILAIISFLLGTIRKNE